MNLQKMRLFQLLLLCVASLSAALAFNLNSTLDPVDALEPASQGYPEIKVVFVGDQGVSSRARAVVDLIVAEEVDFISLGGDLGYSEGTPTITQQWFDLFYDRVYTGEGENKVLPVPILTAIGNHDEDEWETSGGGTQPGYRDRLRTMYDDYMAYQAANPGTAIPLVCTGMELDNIAVRSHCTFGNLSLIYSGIGEVSPPTEQTYLDHISTSFNGDQGQPWRICTWHRNNNLLQLGSKHYNPVGYNAYNLCRKHGAISATYHEHSYNRSHTITNYSAGSNPFTDAMEIYDESLDSNGEIVRLTDHETNGRNFFFLSGLGGFSRRPELPAQYSNPQKWLTSYDWWAAYSVGQDPQRVFTNAECSAVGANPGCGYAEFNEAQETLPNKVIGSDPLRNVTYTDGALFCTFNHGGNQRKALCEFKNVANETLDRFTIYSDVDGDMATDENISSDFTDIELRATLSQYPNTLPGGTHTASLLIENKSETTLDSAALDFNWSGKAFAEAFAYRKGYSGSFASFNGNTIQLENLSLHPGQTQVIQIKYKIKENLVFRRNQITLAIQLQSSITDPDASSSNTTYKLYLFPELTTGIIRYQ